MTGQQGSREEKHEGEEKRSYQKYLKILLDRLLALVGTAALSWLLLGVGIAVRLDSPGPVLFRQKRVGRNGQYFYIYKFRTMRIDTPHDMPTHLLNHPEFLYHKSRTLSQETSLDELPQLFNILKGDISIVGPRPVMEVETEIYGNYRDMLLSVKPGLTGFWAANGRSCTTYTRRRAMEICYIKNRSVCFDLKIILKTITSVFKGEGAV